MQGRIIRATFYRDTTHGKLYLDSDKTDCTESVVKTMDFERSWRGRILKNAEKGGNPFLNFVKGLVDSDKNIICEPVKNDIGDIDLLINKNISEFGKRLKAPDSIYTLEELIRKMQTGADPEELKPEFEKIRKLIHNDIDNQIEQLAKSINHNRIPFELQGDKLLPSTRKMKWLYNFLQDPMDEHMLDVYWNYYNYDELVKKIKKYIDGVNNKTARSISQAVSRAVHEHHRNFRLKFSDTVNQEQSIDTQSVQEQINNNNKKQPNKEDFSLFLKAVEQHFKKYFPVKGKDSNTAYDNKLCEEENYTFFYSYNFVKREVYRSIMNQLVAGLIQQGKLLYYFGGDTWKTEYLNSNGLSYIQVEEAFKKSLMNALSWTIMRLTTFFYDGEVEDIAVHNNEEILVKDILLKESDDHINKRINEVKSNIDIQKRFLEKIAAYYPIKISEDNVKNNDDIDNIIELVKEARVSVAYLRNHSFHYKKASLLDILNAINVYKDKENNNIEFTVAPEFIKRDIEHMYDVFKEQIRSCGILEYYPTWLIEECFITCGLEFNLYSPNHSLIPSFSKVYKKGENLYKSENEYHKGLHWYIEVDNNNPSQVAYKNLLQLIYYHAFLPQVLQNESLVTEFINSTKEWNKKEAEEARKRKTSRKSNNNENKQIKTYRYEAIPEYHGESLDDYLKILQREQIAREKDISEGKTEKNYYIMFIQDVIVRAFDSYLKKISKYKTDLQKPTKQDKDIQEALEELFPKEKKNRKFIIVSRFNKYTEDSKVGNTNTENEGNKNQNESNNTKEQSGIKKEILCFYLFLRLLDAKELSKLQHQFIRYRCSIKDRDNFKNDQKSKNLISLLEELEELMELVRYTIPALPSMELTANSRSYYDTILKNHFGDFFEEGVLDKEEYKKLYYQSDNKTPIPLKHLNQLINSAPLPLYRRMFKKYYLITEDDFKEYYRLSETIEENQKKLNELHGLLIKKKVQTVKTKAKNGKPVVFLKKEDANLVQDYVNKLSQVVHYKHLHSKLTFESLYLIFKIHVEILARMIGYAQDWERDMFFLLKSLDYNNIIRNNIIDYIFTNGNVVSKLNRVLTDNEKKKIFRLCWHKIPTDNNELHIKIYIRNPIAHLNHFTQTKSKPKRSIIEMINALRDLLNYDRKRQNSVTKTIKEMLLKEYHIKLDLKLSNDLKLDICGVENQPLMHLKHLYKGEKCIVDRNSHLREKQEIWLCNGILENPYDDYLLTCIERLLIFPKEVRTLSEHN